jgi:hypothetical protein
MSGYDCTDYDKCPKEKVVQENFYINNEEFNFLFVGCWGVYGKQGNLEEENWDGEKWKPKSKTYGQESVVKAMKKFVEQKGHQQAVILAGDNVYSDSKIPIDSDFKAEIESYGKHYSYNMDKQLQEGFIDSMSKVPTDHFLIGVGNHDIETCGTINKQLNYKENNWTMPGLSYKIMYKYKENPENPEKNFKVNLIFIDTNMYKKKWCFKVKSPLHPLEEQKYPEDAIKNQAEWLGKALDKSRNTWNIVIGHIPFYCSSKKELKKEEGKKPKLNVFNEELYNLILSYAEYIDLYMCADEHNQQYITDLVDEDTGPTYIHDYNGCRKLPPQVIAGSGGTVLDPEFYPVKDSELEKATKYHQSIFGFVSVKVNSKNISVNFNDTQGKLTVKFDVHKKR